MRSSNPKDIIGIKKPRLSLIPPSALIYESLAMGDGAVKYGPYNWRDKKVLLSVYIDALKRHVDSFWDGEFLTRDSGVPHLGAARACLGIIIDALETGCLMDDRPIPGKASDLIDRYTKKSG